jgi:hypothetical protein
MKIGITISNLRECFFQAVSNSSWAHEGYLVALNYDEDEELLSEMRRLSAAFGIGFIKLNPQNIEQSEMIIPAKPKDSVDWETINRLVEENSDFILHCALLSNEPRITLNDLRDIPAG